MNNKIGRDQAVEAANAAENLLFEVFTLRDTAQTIRDVHAECHCDESEEQVRVLAEVAEEKLESVMDHLQIVTQYFESTADALAHGRASEPKAPIEFRAVRDVAKN